MKQKQQSKKSKSHPSKSITKIPLEHSTSHLNRKVKSLLRRLEIGELTDEELNSLDNELKELFVKKIMEINEQKLKQNPKGNKEANEKLLKLAEEGSIVGILHSLMKGANINAEDRFGWTILHFAASKDHLDIIQFFAEDEYLREKVDWNSRANNGWTIAHRAVYNEYLDIIEFFAENKYLREKIDWNAKDDEGGTLLHLAAANDYIDIIKFFFENKENFELIRDSVYVLNVDKFSILDIAVSRVETYLVNKGYSPLIGEGEEWGIYKRTYKELLEKIKTMEDAKRIAEERGFNEDVFILGAYLYFAENCNSNLVNFIS